MKDIDILREARRRIAWKWDNFICCAIESVTRKDGHRLELWVMKMLGIRDNGEAHVYSTWVHDNHLETWGRMSRNDFRQGRLQWLDAMILYLESVGGNLPEGI